MILHVRVQKRLITSSSGFLPSPHTRSQRQELTACQHKHGNYQHQTSWEDKKYEEQESPPGAGQSGCKIQPCLAFKGYLPELLTHLINQGITQAKELPLGCQDGPCTSVPARPLCYQLGHSTPKFLLISNISMH